MDLQDKIKLNKFRALTGVRLHFTDHETITAFSISDDFVMMKLDHFEVKELAREHRFLRKGVRAIIVMRQGTRWFVEADVISWDDSFEPFTFDLFGTVKLPSEVEAQRDFEKQCYRPGKGRFQLDSYERVCDPLIRSTDKMERHY